MSNDWTFVYVKHHYKEWAFIIMVLPYVISGSSGSSCVTAALGNTWSHSVNTRLILQYLGSERRQVSALKIFSDCQV